MQAKGKSYNTYKGDAVFIRKFVAWLSTQGITDFRGVSAKTVLEFQYYLCEVKSEKGKLYEVRTRNNCLAAIKGFFKFLVETEVLYENPASTITYAKEPRTLPKNLLSPAEVKRMMAACNLKTLLGIRNRCVLEVLYDCATRNAETQTIKLTDLDLEAQRLFVDQGKGGRDRYQPLGKVTCRHLAFYIEQVRPKLLKEKKSECLFIGFGGLPAGRAMFGKVVSQCAKLAGINKHVTPHLFRHSVATSLLDNGADVRVIQQFLGHASLQSTMKYTHVSNAAVLKMFKEKHPRERDAQSMTMTEGAEDEKTASLMD